MPPSSSQIPVETVLRMVLDRASADDVRKFMDDHERSWSSIEKYTSKIGDSLESLTRYGLGLAGAAGVGAVAQNFFSTSQYGSNTALAAGNVTGGAGVWHPYGQALLGAQAKTGVAAGDIAQGLIQAVQAVGGNPTPQQAGLIGGLLAGYGQTTGMTPSQVAQVVAPLLQASNQPINQSSLLGMVASMSGNLSAFPGSQAAPMLGLLSQLGVSQAVGSGPGGGFTFDMHGLAATVNAAAQTNRIWRSPGLTGGAINSISGSLQGAYGNPSQEAFLQMAGVSYGQQRRGFTPQNMQSIMKEATTLYGSGTTRDIFLRSMFGLHGADLMETFAPGSKGWDHLQHDLQHHASPHAIQGLINHAQARTTPNARINQASGGLLQWLESSPLHAALGAAGLFGGAKLLRGGIKAAGRGLSGLLGAGEGDAAATLAGDAGGSMLDSLLLSGALGVAGGLGGGILSGLVSPDSTESFHGNANGAQRNAVHQVLLHAQARFGRKGLATPAARNWMQKQLYSGGTSVWGMAVEQAGGAGRYEAGAGKMLDSILGDRYAAHTIAGQDPVLTFSQAATKLLQFANKLGDSRGFSAYHPGSGGIQSVGLGTPGIQMLGASAPGMELASLVLGASGGGSGGGYVSLGLGGGGGAPSNTTPAVGGGAPCLLTWYDPALGGTNSSNGQANPHSATASGTPYSATAMTCAAPPNYAFGTQIQFTYGGKSVVCTVNDRGGAIQGNHFDLARGPATALGIISAGRATGRFKVLSTGTSSSQGGARAGTGGGAGGGANAGAGSGTAVPAMAMGAGGVAPGAGSSAHPGVMQPINVHINVDGQTIRRHRILRGHKA